MELSDSRCRSIYQECSRKRFRRSVYRLHTRWYPHQSRTFLVSSTPAEHLSCRQLVNTVPRSSGLLASLAKKLNKFWWSIMMLLFRASGSTLPPIATWHRICPRVPSQVKSSSTCPDFGFSPNSLDPPHIPSHHAQNGHGDPPAPATPRLILLCRYQHWHCEGLSSSIRVRTSWKAGSESQSVSCPAKSRRAPSSTTTATSLPCAKLVGGSPDPIDPGASTWALPLCPKGMATSMLRAMILIILLRSVDATTPLVQQSRAQSLYEHHSWKQDEESRGPRAVLASAGQQRGCWLVWPRQRDQWNSKVAYWC